MHDWLKFNQNAIPPKIQNIPRYTEAGQYQMTAHLDYIPKWLADNDYDMDPAFQRGHVWTRDQQIAFVEFILRGGTSGRVIYWNNPFWQARGTPVTPDMPDTLLLVDGKQRLSAVLAFLNNDIPAFGHYWSAYSDPADRRFAVARGALTFNVNNLSRYEQVLQWYLDLNAGGTPHTEDEIETVRRMLMAGEKYGG